MSQELIDISNLTDAEACAKLQQVINAKSPWRTISQLQAEYGVATRQTVCMRINRLIDQGVPLEFKYSLKGKGKNRIAVKLTPQLQQYFEKLSPNKRNGA